MQKENKKEIGRVPPRQREELGFPHNFFFLPCFLCIIYPYFAEREICVFLLVSCLLSEGILRDSYLSRGRKSSKMYA